MLSQPFILELPLELCEKLVLEHQLSRQDIRSLRLTCKVFADLGGPALSFDRVVLSRLKEDRDAFEEFVKKHGRYVREVIWQELDIETWGYFNNRLRSEMPPDQRELLEAAVRDVDLFWLPSTCDSSIPILPPRDLWVADWITRGIRNLDTITIQPMPASRKFCYRGHDISPSEFTYEPTYGHARRPTYTSDSQVAFPLLQQTRCKIRTLNVTTNMLRMDLWNVLGNFGLHDKEASRHLESISICALEGFVHDFNKGGKFHRCLQGVDNLRKLKLCFPMDRSDHTRIDQPIIDVEAFVRQLFKNIKWPHLNSLHLVNAYDLFHNISKGKKRSVFSIVASQLRYLTMEDCRLRNWEISFARQGWFPQLESITIRSQGHPTAGEYRKKVVSEERLLAFFRNELEDLGLDLHHTAPNEIITDTEAPLCQFCSPFVPPPHRLIRW
ncbi:hypothetical protein F4801DRAFT_605380 [Xylaria longipes]|nr:hypothetical protein F4801DRAFT_605380 [Xylaria longipes]RYC59643.1 hypothetical protein CHU98_g6566 [Xylaria longipes]